MRTPTIRTLFACAALAALSSLVACGGDGGPVAAPPSQGGGENPPPSPPPPPPPGDFTVSVAADKAVILQGDSVTVTASVERHNGFAGDVTLALSGLPAGVSAGEVTIPAGQDSTTLTLSAAATAPHSLPTAASVDGHSGALAASHGLTVTVRGLPGAVDTSFAGGRIVTQVGAGEDYANAVIAQPDGKILVAGSSAMPGGTRVSLVRYQRDGGLDESFGLGGKVTTAVGATSDIASAIALQDDGKIVVVGRTDQGNATGTDFAVLRYLPDGTPDAGFGNGGKVVTDFAGHADVAHAVLVQPDGKIVVGGEATISTSTTGVDFALARYQPDGTLDAGFGNGGKLTTALKSGSGTDAIYALALQTVGDTPRLVAVGGEGDFLAARYAMDGTLDAGFGNAGKVVGTFESSIGAARGVVVLPQGGLVLAGHMNHDFAFVQLTAAGALDATFGDGGRRIVAVSAGNWDEATALVRQADGALIAGGWVDVVGSSADFALVRLGPDGTLDAGFGTGGIATTAVANGTLSDQSHALVLQADERVPTVRAILAGEANGSNNDFAVVRYWL